MFRVGDIIKHRNTGIYYLVIKKNIFNKSYSELITFEAVRIDDDREIVIMHFPLMTSYFDVIKTPLDTQK